MFFGGRVGGTPGWGGEGEVTSPPQPGSQWVAPCPCLPPTHLGPPPGVGRIPAPQVVPEGVSPSPGCCSRPTSDPPMRDPPTLHQTSPASQTGVGGPVHPLPRAHSPHRGPPTGVVAARERPSLHTPAPAPPSAAASSALCGIFPFIPYIFFNSFPLLSLQSPTFPKHK